MFNRILNIIQRLLPSPFSIALILTFISMLLAFTLTPYTSFYQQSEHILLAWQKGFWELLDFAMQMMLMLILGYVLALSKPINRFIQILTKNIHSSGQAILLVAISSIIISLLNWGLGLIWGAIMVRKIGEEVSRKNIPIHYPLLGTAGYSGLMVWHGGLSGSAPLKVAEAHHFLIDKIGVIPISETLLSPMNLFVTIALIVILPLSLFFLNKNLKQKTIELIPKPSLKTDTSLQKHFQVDHSTVFLRAFSVLVMLSIAVVIIQQKSPNIITINFINFTLLALALWFHKTVYYFLQAINTAIKDASGILIQFPIYAGIMGIMKYTDLSDIFTQTFVHLSTASTFPIYTFISAGIVNIFVPSGGGQWIVQGPIIVETAQQLSIPIHKAIMALAYGDELTNMVQPFWALPLLGITGLKAKDIFPYTLFLMLIGIIIFMTSLLLF